jgi:DNA mismatch endonuclease (patch repair protein)
MACSRFHHSRRGRVEIRFCIRSSFGARSTVTDRFTPEKRSWLMACIRDKNTRPEITVRSTLHRLGFRYRLHRRDLPGRPDIVFQAKKAVILVNGCFWHAHGCKKAGALPTTNTSFWENKIEANRQRDLRNIKQLRNLGWRVLTLWECQIQSGKWLQKARRFLSSCIREAAGGPDPGIPPKHK